MGLITCKLVGEVPREPQGYVGRETIAHTKPIHKKCKQASIWMGNENLNQSHDPILPSLNTIQCPIMFRQFSTFANKRLVLKIDYNFVFVPKLYTRFVFCP